MKQGDNVSIVVTSDVTVSHISVFIFVDLRWDLGRDLKMFRDPQDFTEGTSSLRAHNGYMRAQNGLIYLV